MQITTIVAGVNDGNSRGRTPDASSSAVAAPRAFSRLLSPSVAPSRPWQVLQDAHVRSAELVVASLHTFNQLSYRQRRLAQLIARNEQEGKRRGFRHVCLRGIGWVGKVHSPLGGFVRDVANGPGKRDQISAIPIARNRALKCRDCES